VPKPGSYNVEASMIGFKTKREKRVYVDADANKSIPHRSDQAQGHGRETII